MKKKKKKISKPFPPALAINLLYFPMLLRFMNRDQSLYEAFHIYVSVLSSFYDINFC